ncbi:hypothetical protein SpCBS45565_g06729 [Spizellomyces sp. 'palustris']|nr:hypothetical protein SpCBS45565_g06729 [Spizellomyces sp. 'palustris']
MTTTATTSPPDATPGKPSSTDHAKYFRKALGDVTPNNMGQLKAVNSVLFPVKYSNEFYKAALQVGEFAKLAYFNDVCVGGVICVKQADKETATNRLYIATLGVLAAYRRLGLGAMLLDHILSQATLAKDKQKISEVYLHVQTTNEDALEFYKHRGFDVTSTEEGYYKQGPDPNAYVLTKKIAA